MLNLNRFSLFYMGTRKYLFERRRQDLKSHHIYFKWRVHSLIELRSVQLTQSFEHFQIFFELLQIFSNFFWKISSAVVLLTKTLSRVFFMFKLFIWSFHVYVLDKLLRTDQYHWYLEKISLFTQNLLLLFVSRSPAEFWRLFPTGTYAIIGAKLCRV